MRKFPTRIRLITFSLIIVTLILTFSALFLGNQMDESQKKVRDLQSQITYYQNMTDTLQTQANNLETQINQLQNSTDNVTLTIVSIGPWHGDTIAGYPYYKFINLTLKNYGVRSVGGMTLGFKVEGNTTNIGYLGINLRTKMGVLHENESMNITVQLIASKDGWRVFEDYKLAITLMLDKNALDRKTITIGG